MIRTIDKPPPLEAPCFAVIDGKLVYVGHYFQDLPWEEPLFAFAGGVPFVQYYDMMWAEPKDLEGLVGIMANKDNLEKSFKNKNYAKI